MKLPIEDEIGDILSKAQKALGVSTEVLAAQTGLSEAVVRAARRGEWEEASARVLAEALGLRAEPLIRLARGGWYPEVAADLGAFACLATPFHQLQVNNYLVWDEASKEALLFDTGTDIEPAIAALELRGLQLKAVLLTHSHWDHAAQAGALRRRFGVDVLGPRRELDALSDAIGIGEEFEMELGRLRVSALPTPGHTAGHLSFEVAGLPQPLVIVGDALFAGSMGGVSTYYAESLASVRRLLARSSETVLAPGHGPMTTVAQEMAMNPFWSS